MNRLPSLFLHPSLHAFLLAAALLALLLPMARAEECVRDIDALVARVNAAKNCDAAYKVIDTCNFGASGDVQTGAAVVEKCETAFSTRLAPAQKRAYDRAQARCDRKYAKESGTMYRSFEAFCHAGLARDYARRFSAR